MIEDRLILLSGCELLFYLLFFFLLEDPLDLLKSLLFPRY